MAIPMVTNHHFPAFGKAGAEQTFQYAPQHNSSITAPALPDNPIRVILYNVQYKYEK
jgi:hypothetical protein